MKHHLPVPLSRANVDGFGSSQSVATLLADLEVLRAALSLRKHQVPLWLAMKRAVCEYVDLEDRLKGRMHFATSQPEAMHGQRQAPGEEGMLIRALASASGAINTLVASLDNRQRGMFATTVVRVLGGTSATMS
jgi:hypothetical protein